MEARATKNFFNIQYAKASQWNWSFEDSIERQSDMSCAMFGYCRVTSAFLGGHGRRRGFGTFADGYEG